MKKFKQHFSSMDNWFFDEEIKKAMIKKIEKQEISNDFLLPSCFETFTDLLDTGIDQWQIAIS